MLPLNRSVAQVQYHLRFATFGITTNAQKKRWMFCKCFKRSGRSCARGGGLFRMPRRSPRHRLTPVTAVPVVPERPLK